jgi:hypothetical protein
MCAVLVSKVTVAPFKFANTYAVFFSAKYVAMMQTVTSYCLMWHTYVRRYSVREDDRETYSCKHRVKRQKDLAWHYLESSIEPI